MTILATLRSMIDDLLRYARDEHTGDNAAKVYRLVNRPVVAGSDIVTVGGVLKVRDTDYTIDNTNGVITFSVAPGSGVAVVVTYNYQMFSDADIQEVIDLNTVEIEAETLTPMVEIGTGHYHVFTSVFTNLSSATLQDDTGVVHTPDSSNLTEGKFTFTIPVGHDLVLVGAAVDLYAAAAMLCSRKAGRYASDFDVSLDGQGMSRSQVTTAWLNQSRAYGRKAWGKNTKVS